MCGLDIFPTTAELCGVAVPPGLHGRSYAAALRSGEHVRDAVLVQWEDTRFAFGDHPYRALRTGTHTYVVGRDDAFCLLFDHRDDPYERRNRFWDDDARALRRTLHERLSAEVTSVEGGAPPYLARRAP